MTTDAIHQDDGVKEVVTSILNAGQKQGRLDEVVEKLTEYLEAMDMTVPADRLAELVKTATTKPLSRGAAQARLRPKNYHRLSARQQWEIDRELDILDWDGSC